MKKKRLLITTIIFFLIVNTAYYWEVHIGLRAIPAFGLLLLIYLGLALKLIQQLYLLIKEKFTDKNRLLTTGILIVVLTVTYLKPFGFIDLDKLEGDNILVAVREGVANCTITLILKDNFTFKERSICFGITEVKGKYRIANDTIYFEHNKRGSNEKELYEFAVIELSSKKYSKILGSVIMYKNSSDTIGSPLGITSYNINKLNTK